MYYILSFSQEQYDTNVAVAVSMKGVPGSVFNDLHVVIYFPLSMTP